GPRAGQLQSWAFPNGRPVTDHHLDLVSVLSLQVRWRNAENAGAARARRGFRSAAYPPRTFAPLPLTPEFFRVRTEQLCAAQGLDLEQGQRRPLRQHQPSDRGS